MASLTRKRKKKTEKTLNGRIVFVHTSDFFLMVSFFVSKFHIHAAAFVTEANQNTELTFIGEKGFC